VAVSLTIGTVNANSYLIKIAHFRAIHSRKIIKENSGANISKTDRRVSNTTVNGELRSIRKHYIQGRRTSQTYSDESKNNP